MHQLNIDIAENLRVTSFKVTDSSSYDANLAVSDGWLEIYAPGSIQPMLWKVTKDFKVIVNSNLLHLTSDIITPLPDGTYYVKYSVKPNNQVLVQYAYFRNTKQLNDYYNLTSSLIAASRTITNKEYNAKIKDLLWIKNLIDAAKYMVEENHKLNEANLMYVEANSLIEKMGCYVQSLGV